MKGHVVQMQVWGLGNARVATANIITFDGEGSADKAEMMVEALNRHEYPRQNEIDYLSASFRAYYGPGTLIVYAKEAI